MGDDAELFMETGGDPSILCNDVCDDETDDFPCVQENYVHSPVIDAECKRCFFVDYENVNRVGLNGILKLSETDCVRIYYSKNAEALTFGLHRRINASKAHFEYIKVQMPIKNAIDCQILYQLQDMAKLRKDIVYYIVSNDTDFDASIEMFRQLKFQVFRIAQICQRNLPETKAAPAKSSEKTGNLQTAEAVSTKKTKVSEEKRERQIRSFYGQYFKDELHRKQKEATIQAILKSKTKTELNSCLTKLYPGDVVKQMFTVLKPLLEDLPKH